MRRTSQNNPIFKSFAAFGPSPASHGVRGPENEHAYKAGKRLAFRMAAK
jgi:hypothetical protein